MWKLCHAAKIVVLVVLVEKAAFVVIVEFVVLVGGCINFTFSVERDGSKIDGNSGWLKKRYNN
jgi:hypothetical protein